MANIKRFEDIEALRESATDVYMVTGKRKRIRGYA